MSREARAVVAELAADLVKDAFGRGRGLGVFVENMPPMDPLVFVSTVAESQKECRVAVLGDGTDRVKAPRHVEITVDPTRANEWRNDRKAGRSPTVILVLGPAPKLNSLRSTLTLLGPTDLRAAVTARAIQRLESPERRAFWGAIGRSSAISLDALITYFETCIRSARGESALLEMEPANVHLLGLLRDDGLVNSAAPTKTRAALRRNLDLVARIRDLSARDRRALLADADEELDSVTEQILRFSRSKSFEDLRGLVLSDVQTRLRPPKKDAELNGGGGVKRTMEGDALALDLLLQNAKGLGVAAQRFAREVEPDEEGVIEAEEVSVGSKTIAPRLREGTTQVIGAVTGSLCSADVWGGVVQADRVNDVVAALRLAAAADVDRTPFTPNSDGGVRELLSVAVNSGFVPPSALAAWDRYAEVRARVLKHAVALCDHPLLALAGDQSLRDQAKELITSAAAALTEVHAAASSLRETSPESAKRLRARALAADLIFVFMENQVCAVAAPTHPFHLWRWLTLHDAIATNREEMATIGFDAIEPLVTDPPAVAPHVVLSTFALDMPIERTMSFVASGSIGALPLFAEPGSREAGRFRSRALAQISERLLRVMPHASLGLRVTLVDPMSVAGALERLLDLKSTLDGETPVPVHLTIARTRPAPEATDEEEEVLEALARDLREAGGSLDVAPPAKSLKDVAAFVRTHPPHLCVVFDPGDSRTAKFGVSAPPLLSPLVLPRAYTYDAIADRLDVVVAGKASEFSAYQQIFCDLTDTPLSDFLGRRSGASLVHRDLEALAMNSVWFTVVDQGLEPTLTIAGSTRIDARSDSGRDLITFSAHNEVVEDLVADALRQVGLRANDETIKRTLRELLQLSGEALLWLARQKVSIDLADSRVARGLLGVLAAVRWYSQQYPDALVVSLDDPLSRRWILGASQDNRHGDLLFIRPEKDGVVVEAVEVKSYDSDADVIAVKGANIEGRAVTQADQTIAILRKILVSAPTSMIDLARQAVLRDQLYRAVAGRPYDRDRRRRLVALLEALFRDGATQLSGLVVSVRIESRTAPQMPSGAKYATSPGGNSVGYVELVESEVAAGRVEPRPDSTPAAGSTSKAKAKDVPAKPIYVHADVPALKAAEKVSDEKTKNRSVYIGRAADGTDVAWDTGRTDNPLNNFGLLVTGDSGAGKTQVLRAVVAELCRAGLPVCVFDFKNDYASPDFAEAVGLRVHDVDRRGLPFNPLALLGDAEGNAQPIRLIHEVVGILKRIFKLGEQQEARLRQGVQAAFEQRGFEPKARARVKDLPAPPSFNDVVETLRQDLKKNEALLNRLSPLFDLDLFPSSDDDAVGFDELLNDRVVLDLHSLPNDEIKAALAEFLIVRIHTYMLKGEQPRKLRRLLVLDEAWRVAQSERLQELAREGRAFGVGLAIGTQFPGDLPENLSGSLASQLLLQNSDPEHRKNVAKTLCGTSSGAQAQQLIRRIDHLRKHEGFFRNQHYAPYVLVETLPHYKRK